ncbi:MAG: NAD(+)/NADH kinase [Chloroflexi bacterium]|nr:NAD(+)/NADH kinase [Chloroflexota bacterium]
MRTVGILYRPHLEAAATLARQLAEALEARGDRVWLTPAWQEGDGLQTQLDSTDVLVGLGGDGTILLAARATLARAIPILGVNFGRLGFLAELPPHEALARIPALLDGQGHIEDRAMLQARLHRFGEAQHEPPDEEPEHHALNDVVVGRYAPGRPIYIEVAIDGQFFNTYRCDGIIVSSATGSTGYNLSVGGPILHPQAQDLVLIPVAPHLNLRNALVLQPDTMVELRVRTDHQAVLAVDGQLNLPLSEGDRVEVRRSPYVTRFLRTGERSRFYETLVERLR